MQRRVFARGQDIGRRINRIYRYFQNERDAHNSWVYHEAAKRSGRQMSWGELVCICRDPHLQPSILQNINDASGKQSNNLLCITPFSIPRGMNVCSHFITISIWWMGGAPFSYQGLAFFRLARGAFFNPHFAIPHQWNIDPPNKILILLVTTLIILGGSPQLVCIPGALKAGRQIMGWISYSTFPSSDFRIYWR